MTKAMTTGILSGLLLVWATVAPVHAADEEKKPQTYVVLVGIDAYADKQIKPRTHAEADAKAFHDLFIDKDYLGVDPQHVRLLLGKADEKRNSEPATHANILKALRWLVSKAGKDDLVVLGLFCQGAPMGERSCYFANDSTFKGRDKNALAAVDVEHELDKLKSQKFCGFLDVDFKGFDLGKEEAPEINLNNLYKEWQGKEENGTHAGRILFLANTGLKPSLELEKHGLFTQVALDALKGKADTEGYEPDGVVTIDELIEYLNKHMPELVKKHGKTKEEKEQIYLVLGGLSGHFAITHNPAVAAKIHERLEKLAKLAEDKKISRELADEGKRLLSRMPKLEAHRSLRKDFQGLVDGKLSIADFEKDRTKLLEGMKFKRDDALVFAAKVIQASEQVRDGYVKEINQGELVGWAIKGLYQRVDEKIPKEIKDRLDKVKEMKEADLTMLLADVRERLGNREDLDKQKDVNFALQQMLRHLDPYTTFIDRETLDRFKAETDATFTGIGIQIRKDTNRDMLQVISPIKDSPAYKAGLKAGDVITGIKREMDSKGVPIDPPEIISTKGLALSDAVKKILGKEGTKVKLTVDREGSDKSLEFEITRGIIEVETVLGVKRKDDDSWDYVMDHSSRICYVRLTQFAPNTARELAIALEKLEKANDGNGIKGLILDLRFNPGGLLNSAVQISDMFIDDGLIVSIRPRVGRENSFSGEHEGSLLKFPMVCLVNGGSASGSEIVAACLQDHHRAIVMGERSYGKGSVQNIQSFEGGRLKMTTATYWRPNGKNIHKSATSGKDEDEWGVSPNAGYVLKLNPKDREDLAEHQRNSEIIQRHDLEPKKDPKKDLKPEFKDRQLEKALEYLRSQMKTAAKSTVKKTG